MTLKRLAIGAILMLALGMSPAQAQAQDAAATKQEQAYGRKVLQDFAKCAVGFAPEIARKYVLAPLSERIPEDEWNRLVNSRCLGLLGGKLTMSGFYYRAALAEELIAKRSGDLAAWNNELVAPLTWEMPEAPAAADPASGDALATETVLETQNRYLADMKLYYVNHIAECVVRADPAGARTIFSTAVDSSREKAAMQAISPRIVECVAKGDTVSFNRTVLRSAMAVSYYRLSDTMAQAARLSLPAG